MQLPPLLPARLIVRENRFLALVDLDGKPVRAHVADPGRLEELLVPGRTVWVARAGNVARKTDYGLVLVQHGDHLVSVDARLPNALFREAVLAGRTAFRSVIDIRQELRRGDSRLDFRLIEEGEGVHWVEIKSVTLVEEGVALFPDAPTVRGRRHLRELMAAVRAGERASVVFIIQRGDATCFRPYRRMDPDLADALAEAHVAGVQVHAHLCRISLASIEVAGEVPVELDTS